MFVFDRMIQFWIYTPALLYGISFFLGIYSRFYPSFSLAIPLFILWSPFIALLFRRLHEGLKSLSLSIFILFTGYGYAVIFSPLPEIPDPGIDCIVRIRIDNLRLQQSPFGKKWIYRCTILEGISSGSNFPIPTGVPCIVGITEERASRVGRPAADKDYLIKGILTEKDSGIYFFKPSPKIPWVPVSDTRSFAEMRYLLKKKVSNKISESVSNRKSADFLAGLATGEFDDYEMKEEFGRFGLLHILAISGFHFAVVAGFLGFFLRFFFSMKTTVILLLALLSGYAFFLGAQPSIMRAWLMSSAGLFGMLIHKKANPLNSLGIAGMMILAYDPNFSRSLTFQLSFAVTLSILLVYPLAQAWSELVIPKRSLEEMLRMNGLNRHGYCLLVYLRSALALTVAVNVLALPLTLFYFQKFPVAGVLYNLFFPLLVSLSLSLLLLGSFLSFIPFLGSFVHRLNSFYTDYVLRLTYEIPYEIDVYLRMYSADAIYLTLYVSLLIGFAIIRQSGLSEDERESESFFV